VLRTFADVAAASIREDDLIARLGGEEFGLILWSADLSEAHAVCERLRREIEDLSIATRAGSAIGVTFSGGLAQIVDGTRDEIVRQADEALYRAKNSGRNRLVAAA
jgi:diguanylate cyclase (GGDEF)-like protein